MRPLKATKVDNYWAAFSAKRQSRSASAAAEALQNLCSPILRISGVNKIDNSEAFKYLKWSHANRTHAR
jgi:hypothetical protein